VLRIGLSLTLALATFAAANAARADSPATANAQALFDEGKRLVAARQFEQACERFKASQALDPRTGTLLNLAECYATVGRTATAAATFLEAATSARRSAQGEREALATSRARELDARAAHMTIVVPITGVEVTRDGVPVDAADLGRSLAVDRGQHRIVARSGKRSYVADVRIAEDGERVTVQIPLLDEANAPPAAAPTPASPSPTPASPGPAPVTSPAPAPAPGASPLRTVGLAIGGAGVVGVGIGTVLGLFASSTWSDAKNNHCHGTICDPTGIQEHDRANGEALGSTVAFAVGLAAVAAGTVVWLAAPHAEPATATVRAHPFANARTRAAGTTRLPPLAIVE
jgi:serine/threonine-protein kinase